MVITNFWLDMFWEMAGVEGLLVALQSLSLLKRALDPSIYNRISPFRNFYDNSFNTKCPGLDNKIIIVRCAHIALYVYSAIAMPMIISTIIIICFRLLCHPFLKTSFTAKSAAKTVILNPFSTACNSSPWFQIAEMFSLLFLSFSATLSRFNIANFYNIFLLNGFEVTEII